MKHSHIWTLTYRGITAEIRKWRFKDDSATDNFGKISDTIPLECTAHDFLHRENWNKYIYVNLEQLTDKSLAAKLWLEDKIEIVNGFTKIHHDYLDSDFLSKLDFHCDITYYEKKFPKSIKVGDDYQHCYDEGHQYSEIYLKHECYHLINSLHDNCEYLLMCSGNGKLYKENEGVYPDNATKETFYSNEWLKSKESKII